MSSPFSSSSPLPLNKHKKLAKAIAVAKRRITAATALEAETNTSQPLPQSTPLLTDPYPYDAFLSALTQVVEDQRDTAQRFPSFCARSNHDVLYDFGLDTQLHEYNMDLAPCRGLHEFMMQIGAGEPVVTGCPFCAKRKRGLDRGDVVDVLKDLAEEMVREHGEELEGEELEGVEGLRRKCFG